MTAATSTTECKLCVDENRLPNAFVVHLSGNCCRCGESDSKHACSKCQDGGPYAECRSLNQSVVVRRESGTGLLYTHTFQKSDFAANKKPLRVEKLTLRLTKHEVDGKSWHSACVVLSFEAEANLRPVAWYRAKVHDCCDIGTLRLHAANAACRWPRSIEINGTPTPDYVPPQPEWVKGNPDDLNDAEFWPALDIPLMQDSAEVPVRFFNGELQLRMKDIGSDGFGFPWGHTRIYSNRLSNSHDFGNGHNWMILEWPQLVRRHVDPQEVAQLHSSGTGTPTGCCLVVVRGTRNALWFDEFIVGQTTDWRPRFGAKHTLETEARNRYRLTYPNGHISYFYAFTSACCRPFATSPTQDPRLDGRLFRHVGPAGWRHQSIDIAYLDGRVFHVTRTAVRPTTIQEDFAYEYIQEGENRGRLKHVTWSRSGKNLQRAEYTYYDGPVVDTSHTNAPPKNSFGKVGDLKTVIIQVYDKLTQQWANRPNAVQYFRYATGSLGTYCQGLLQSVIAPESYHRMVQAGLDPLTASDSDIRQFADVYVEYHDGDDPFTERRVKSISLAGGARTHTFDYKRRTAKRVALPLSTPGYNLWHTTTTESRPDHTTKSVCSNFIGATIRLDLLDGSDRWVHYWTYYDRNGAVHVKYDPSMIEDGSAASTDARTAQPKLGSKGIFHSLLYTWDSRQRAFLTEIVCPMGQKGEPNKLKSFGYQTVNDAYGIRAVNKETTFGVGSMSTERDAVTQYDYTWTGLAAIHTRKTTLPAVSPVHFQRAERYNSQNTQGETLEEYNPWGNLVKATDLRGTVTVNKVDVAKGSLEKQTVTYRKEAGLQATVETLEFDYESNDYGQIEQVLGPLHFAVVPGTSSEQQVRAATWYVYKPLSGETRVAQGYVANQKSHVLGPVEIKWHDHRNRVTDVILAERTGTGRIASSEEFPQNTWLRWIHQSFDDRQLSVTTRRYHAIPGTSGDGAEQPGVAATPFYETTSRASIAERTRTIRVSSGTHYETTFNALSLPVRLRSSINGGELQEVLALEYDDDASGGDGNLTRITRKEKADGQETVRATSLGYDSRGRNNWVVEPDGGRLDYEYNGQNTVTKIVRSLSHSPNTVLAERAQLLDVRGRVIQTQLNGQYPRVNGKPPAAINEYTLYDSANQVIAIESAGSRADTRPLTLYGYDGLGRVVLERSLVEDLTQIQQNGPIDPAAYLWETHSQKAVETQFNRTGDVVLQRVLEAVPGKSDRVSQVAHWYDPFGRIVATAHLPTPEFGDLPKRSSTIPEAANIAVNRHEYNNAGELASTTDALGHVVRLGYDHAGRVVRQGANLPASLFQTLGTSEVDPADLLHSMSDDATYSTFTYTPEDKRTKSVAYNSRTGAQVARVDFGQEGAGAPPPSAMLPRQFVDAVGRTTAIEYSNLGQVFRAKDGNGTVHEYRYDQGGRVRCDRIVEVSADAVDTKVRRIQYDYDSFGRLKTVTSYDSKDEGQGSILNQVVRRYGSYNELIVEGQLHSGKDAARRAFVEDATLFHGSAASLPSSATTSVPGFIGYFYDYPSASRNNLQLRTVWYPGDSDKKRSGRRVTFGFNSQIDEVLGRVGYVQMQSSVDDKTHLSRPIRYGYWSDRKLYSIEQINVDYSFFFGRSGVAVATDLSMGTGVALSSLDPMGREWRRRWKRNRREGLFSSSSNPVVDLRYTFDLNDNILSRHDTQTAKELDDFFKYDALDRIVLHERGRLNGDKSGVSPNSRKLRQNWRKDQTGNWREFARREFVVGGTILEQKREHFRTNDIWKIQGGGWLDPGYDLVGSMVRMPEPANSRQAANCRYDAWNRLVAVTDEAGNRTQFEYDGLGRRIVQRVHVAGGGTSPARHYYYDQAGRVITETLEPSPDGVSFLDREYIWDVNDPHRLACRIRHVTTAPGVTESEYLYPLQDVAGNTVALVDDRGEVKERYLYDPQGIVTYLTPAFEPKPGTSYDWNDLLYGMRLDAATGLHFTGGGYYHAALGRLLPTGTISVLPESQLNSYAQDFPLGSYRPPPPTAMEELLRWAGEQSPWIKTGIGVAAMAFAVGYSGVLLLTGNPWGAFAALGAIAGGLQGGIEASLSGGDFGDVMLGAGLGAAFGAIVPWGGIGSLVGSAVAARYAIACGKDIDSIASAWQWGGLIGGIAGDFTGGAASAAKFGARRALTAGLVHVGPDLIGAGAGAIIGYSLDGTSTGALHGATLGMMAGGLIGAAARGLSSVRRGLVPASPLSDDPLLDANILIWLEQGRPQAIAFAERYQGLLSIEHRVAREFINGRVRRHQQGAVYLHGLMRRYGIRLLSSASLAEAQAVTQLRGASAVLNIDDYVVATARHYNIRMASGDVQATRAAILANVDVRYFNFGDGSVVIRYRRILRSLRDLVNRGIISDARYYVGPLNP